MSLVEQAARRLEELRNAGKQVSGDLAFPQTRERASAQTENPGTIARIAKVLEEQKRLPPEPQPTPAPVAPAVGVLPDSNGLDPYVAKGRREPLLNEVAPKAEQGGAAASTAGAGRRASKVVPIDLARLAANGLLTPDSAQSRLANELRVIKRPLINNCLGKSAGRVKNANRIMLTSALPGEGKSFLSTNLAMSIATERDSTVLLVEADTTRPSLAAMLGIPGQRGLMNLLVEPNLDVSDVLVKTNVARFSFIPAGTRHEHSTELLASEAMEKLIEHLASRYSDRVLLFDAPPLLAAPEARVLAHYMGQIVFVVEAEKTTHRAVQQALESIDSCPVVLLALNKTVSREEHSYYYYG